jgi:hypothetical protein
MRRAEWMGSKAELTVAEPSRIDRSDRADGLCSDGIESHEEAEMQTPDGGGFRRRTSGGSDSRRRTRGGNESGDRGNRRRRQHLATSNSDRQQQHHETAAATSGRDPIERAATSEHTEEEVRATMKIDRKK